MIRCIWLILLYTLLLSASIDDEIDRIQNAPIKERFKLMNRLKEKIANMQEEKRMESIKKLKLATNGELITISDTNSSESRAKKHIKDILIEHINTSIKEYSKGVDDD